MRPKSVAFLLADVGVTKTHRTYQMTTRTRRASSRQYRPEFPERFGSIEDGRAFSRSFFDWYDHHHSGIGFCLQQRGCGRAEEAIRARHEVLLAAYEAHPERFVRKTPELPRLPAAVWINPPEKKPSQMIVTLNSTEKVSQNY